MRGRRLLLLAILPLLALPAIRPAPTAASWTDREFVAGSATTASADCSTTGAYTTTGRGRFLTGTLAGSSLDPIAALTGIGVVNSGTAVTATPGSTLVGTNAYRSGITASAIDGAVSAGLSATLPLSWPSAGVYTQYARADSTGFSAGASGAVTDTGAVDTAGLTAGTQPAVGTLDVSSVLAATTGGTAAATGLSGVTLRIGAVAATASLDQCALLWGTSRSTALARGYRVSSLSLGLTDAAATTLLGTIGSQSSTVTAALSPSSSALTAASTGISGTAGSGLLAAVTSALGSSGLLSPVASLASPGGASATITTDLTPVTTALTERLTDPSGVLTFDAGTGSVVVDLGALQTLNGQAANTSVLTAAQATAIETALVSVLQTHVSHVESAWTAALNAATLHVTAKAIVAATVGLVQVNVASVSVDYTGTVAQFLAGTETKPAATVTALGSVSLTALTAALTPALLSTDLFTPVESTVRSALSTPLTSTITTATNALTAAATAAATASAPQIAALSTFLALTLNEQPDADPGPPSYLGTTTAGIWAETALRVAVRVNGTDALALFLASASVGRNHTLNTP